MKLLRREFLSLSLGAATCPGFSSLTTAQGYPARPIRIVVPFAAGGNTDLIARLIGQLLTERLGQPCIIENRPGGGTNIGTEAVVKSPPDGYTLLLASPSINATLYEKLSFNYARDIAPVVGVIRVDNVMEVNSSVPARSVPEFISYAKENPDKLNFGSGGVGTGSHMSGELFKMMAGVDIVHVPYRGTAPAHADLLAGQVQVMFAPMPTSIEFVRSGKVRALATTGPARSELLPDTPAIREFIPGYEATNWYGLAAPKNTPAVVIERLNKELNRGLADPGIKTRLIELGGTVLGGSPEDFAALNMEETERWAKVIRTAKIKTD
jgi:tripartite-type tricarboxylate transporter receptor subunit TctC